MSKWHSLTIELLGPLLASVGWTDVPLDRLEVEDTGIALATEWPVTANSLAALAAVGLAASRLREIRTGRRERVRIDTRQAGLAMASSTYLSIDRRAAKFRDPFTGFYEARNGEWVFMHGNFPHLRDGLLALLGARDAEEARERMRRQDAREFERQAIKANLCAAFVRRRAQWELEEQAAAIAGLPLVEITRLGGGGPTRERTPNEGEALAGLRVLDLSRVIAGPMAGRTLAENGAEVLLVSGPGLPSILSLVVDTGFAKRSAEIDLKSEGGLTAFRHLAKNADVILDAYRPGALAALGLGATELAALSPGLVHVELDAFGRVGPWTGRRGYDSLVQATMGFCRIGDEPPRNLPCQPLDYLTGYLAAFGAMVGLIRRHEEGGAFAVRLSLARSAHWMRETFDALGPEEARPARNPMIEEIGDLLDDHATAFGDVRALRPPLRPVGWRWSSAPVQLGTHGPHWL